MIARHYVELFDAGDPDRARAENLAGRTHELLSFLVDVLGVARVPARYDGVITYHDACAGLRELGLKGQARALLGTVEGAWLTELEDTEVCCGFGGTFCVKYPDISNKMVDEKAQSVERSGADTLLSGDLGCLMNIAGKLHRRGSGVQVRHVAEVLAGTARETAAIGHGEADAAQRTAAARAAAETTEG
jgi:L-lactate dehydrogenase complex protein LldE